MHRFFQSSYRIKYVPVLPWLCVYFIFAINGDRLVKHLRFEYDLCFMCAKTIRTMWWLRSIGTFSITRNSAYSGANDKYLSCMIWYTLLYTIFIVCPIIYMRNAEREVWSSQWIQHQSASQCLRLDSKQYEIVLFSSSPSTFDWCTSALNSQIDIDIIVNLLLLKIKERIWNGTHRRIRSISSKPLFAFPNRGRIGRLSMPVLLYVYE